MTQQRVIEELSPHDLTPHPDNPRFNIDVGSPEMADFAANLQKHGIIQPIIWMWQDGKRLILAGHKRRAGAMLAGLKTVPTIETKLQSEQFVEDYFLSENGQRFDLSPVEFGKALLKLSDRILEQKGTRPNQMDFVRRLDVPVAQIRQSLAMMELSPRLQTLYHNLELPPGSAPHLLKLNKYPDEIDLFADRILRRQINLSSLPKLIDLRIAELESAEYVAPVERSPRHQMAGAGNLASGHSIRVTRETAMEAINANTRKKISLFDIRNVLDSICCSCGMINNVDVCSTCPLPRFVTGIVGRAD